MKVLVKRLRDNAQLPEYMTQHAAGMDLCAALDEELVLMPGQRTLVPTGLAFKIPHGYEGQVRPRSGLALKQGIALVNSPGTVDADYRGEVGVIVINHGQDPVVFNHGDRIAQMVIAAVVQASLDVVEQLPESGRNSGGFGHTGVRKD